MDYENAMSILTITYVLYGSKTTNLKEQFTLREYE